MLSLQTIKFAILIPRFAFTVTGKYARCYLMIPERAFTQKQPQVSANRVGTQLHIPSEGVLFEETFNRVPRISAWERKFLQLPVR